MDQRYALRIVAPAVGAVVVLAGVGLTTQGATAETVAASYPRTAARDTRAVTQWIERNAHGIGTIDPAAPLDDMEPLRRSVGDASIVGLGEPTHGVKEVTTLKHRTLRFLVERMGFRTIALEDDWTLGLEINEYIRTGKGDLDALLKRTTGAWANREFADTMNWLRDFNSGREEGDKVQFVGVEYFTTWLPAYDIVKAHVAKVSPGNVRELGKHMKVLLPREDDAWAHAFWYAGVRNKERYLQHARQMYDLVRGLPHRPGDRAYSLALHAARQILSFYEAGALPGNEPNVYRDARAAENLRWWRGYDRSKIAYWAASPHTAVAPHLLLTDPSGADLAYPAVGSYLRRWYGTDYRSIGFTFDHGTVPGGEGAIDAPPPPEDWFEHPFGLVSRYDQMLMDLRVDAPAPVREWLRASARTRGLVDRTPQIPYDSTMSGGTLEQWFDVIVHRQEVTPARPL